MQIILNQDDVGQALAEYAKKFLSAGALIVQENTTFEIIPECGGEPVVYDSLSATLEVR